MVQLLQPWNKVVLMGIVMRKDATIARLERVMVQPKESSINLRGEMYDVAIK